MLRIGHALALAFSVSACGNTGDAADPGEPSAADACNDLAGAVASAAARCGQDYQTNHDAFVASAALGDCDNIVRIRDREDLYGTCIPSLSSLACSDLFAGNLDATCREQLGR